MHHPGVDPPEASVTPAQPQQRQGGGLTLSVAAWLYPGHTPRPSLDDPEHISAIVNVPLSAFWVLKVCMPAGLLISFLSVGRDVLRWFRGFRAGGSSAERRHLLAPVLFWGVALLLLRLDPGDVLAWILD
jgi:hypothetical protein